MPDRRFAGTPSPRDKLNTPGNAIKRAEAKAGRKLSFAEVGTPGASHLELMLAGEMQWAMQQMFRQYDAIADLLVPEQQVPEVESQPEPAAKPARSKHPMLNLGE